MIGVFWISLLNELYFLWQGLHCVAIRDVSFLLITNFSVFGSSPCQLCSRYHLYDTPANNEQIKVASFCFLQLELGFYVNESTSTHCTKVRFIGAAHLFLVVTSVNLNLSPSMLFCLDLDRIQAWCFPSFRGVYRFSLRPLQTLTFANIDNVT